MARKSGDRFRLVIYEYVVARYRRPTFVLGLLFLGLWLAVFFGYVDWPPLSAGPWLLTGGAVATFVWLFTWLGPGMAYVQPQRDHLRLQTPIYRLKVSYRRIHSTGPVNLVKMFPPKDMKRSERAFLQPFYGATALGVVLRGYPVPPWVLRLFVNRFVLARGQPGLVLVVPEWMLLSEQISVLMDNWQSVRQTAGGTAMTDAARVLAAPSRPWWKFW